MSRTGRQNDTSRREITSLLRFRPWSTNSKSGRIKKSDSGLNEKLPLLLSVKPKKTMTAKVFPAQTLQWNHPAATSMHQLLGSCSRKPHLLSNPPQSKHLLLKTNRFLNSKTGLRSCRLQSPFLTVRLRPSRAFTPSATCETQLSRRRDTVAVSAFGQPLPEPEEQEFELPADYVTAEVLKARGREWRRRKRESAANAAGR